ncbi:MAG TPA: SAM-dependent methyltransferase [Candidatus Dormibacteraeota bacterium]
MEPVESAGPAPGRRPGRLVVIGSGIRAIGQFTLEAEAYLRWADVVYYNVIDEATARWIVERSARAVDLYALYDDDKPRTTSYLQMAELMLRSVREGLNVAAVFYGHPGVFVHASHRAIALARREGHAATMLPAVSALDCLFADLGVDPCEPGCQVVGATDLLLRRRPLLTESNVVILQVGMVGHLEFQLGGFANDRFPVLVRYLQEAYGDEHPVVHYIAAEYPTVEPTIDRWTVGDLHGPAARARLNEASTFYLPPRGLRSTDGEMAAALGLTAADVAGAETFSLLPSGPLDEERERQAIEALRDHRPPPGYRPARPSPALARLIEELALDPGLLDRYGADPERFLAGRPDLSAMERAALLSGDRRWLHVVMRRSGPEVARELARRALADPGVARRLHERGPDDPDLDATPAELARALDELVGRELGLWAGTYQLAVDGARRGTLTVTPEGGALLAGAPLTGHRFEEGTLSWSDAGGCAGALRFFVLTDAEDRPLPAAAYAGPQLAGRIWPRGAAAPEAPNAFGKIGVHSAGCLADALGTDPLDAWAGEYATHVSLDDATWRPGPVIAVGPDAAGAYADGTLRWSPAGSELSGSVLLFERDGSRLLVGRLWQGHGQPSPAVNCVGRRRGEPAGQGPMALPAVVAAGMVALADRSRAVAMAAGTAAIRAGAAAGEADARRLRAETEALLRRVFLPPAPGDMARVRARLELGVLAARADRD